jgi:hypothetical protein
VCRAPGCRPRAKERVMPLSSKGKKVLKAMKKTYGSAKKAKQVLYASKNAGTVKGVEKKSRKK